MTDPHETARKLVEAGIVSFGGYIDEGLSEREHSGVAWLWHSGSVDVYLVPDLSDPATCGVLMGMLMECSPDFSLRRFRRRCHTYLPIIGEERHAPTLGEALALTLLEMKETTDEC